MSFTGLVLGELVEMLLSFSFFACVLCLALLHYSPLSSEGDLVKQTEEPAVPGDLSHPLLIFLILSWSPPSLWEFSGLLGVFQGFVWSLASRLCGHSYAAGHPVGAQGLMHVGKLWEYHCRAGTLGVKTLDKERKKRIGMKCILVQDRQFLKLKSRGKWKWIFFLCLADKPQHWALQTPGAWLS